MCTGLLQKGNFLPPGCEHWVFSLPHSASVCFGIRAVASNPFNTSGKWEFWQIFIEPSIDN